MVLTSNKIMDHVAYRRFKLQKNVTENLVVPITRWPNNLTDLNKKPTTLHARSRIQTGIYPNRGGVNVLKPDLI